MMSETMNYTAYTGNEFYQLVNRIVSRRAQQGKLPALANYLSSLWHLASQHKQGPVPTFTYSRLTEWFDKAFDYPPMPFDWKSTLQKEYLIGVDYQSEVNTPAYRDEINTYAYFEKVIKRQIEELKRGYGQQPWDAPRGPVVWENSTVEGFLERAVSSDEDWYELEEDIKPGWFRLVGYLHSGQWTE